jgi:hypothetical protein
MSRSSYPIPVVVQSQVTDHMSTTKLDTDTAIVGISATIEACDVLADLAVGGDAAIAGDFAVAGDSTVEALTVGTNLSVNGTSHLVGAVTASNNLTITQNLAVGGNTTHTGTLTNTGNATFGGTLTATGNGQFNASLNVADTSSANNLLARQSLQYASSNAFLNLSWTVSSTGVATAAVINSSATSLDFIATSNTLQYTGSTSKLFYIDLLFTDSSGTGSSAQTVTFASSPSSLFNISGNRPYYKGTSVAAKLYQAMPNATWTFNATASSTGSFQGYITIREVNFNFQ